MAPSSHDVVRFGVFEFNLQTGELWKQGTRVPLEPQPARALTHLLADAGEVVGRDTLKNALWNGDVHVDFDRGLAYCIAQVRSALGDSADNPRFVETLPRRGFRFIAPVSVPAAGGDGVASDAAPGPAALSEPVATQTPERAARTSTRVGWLVAIVVILVTIVVIGSGLGRTEKRPILAVAIFDNETGSAEFDPFANGMSDALVARLGALDVSKLGVMGNARSLRMPRSERDLDQISADTGAQFILLGQLQNLPVDDPASTAPVGLRVFAHLIRLSDGTHVWVKRIDRPDRSLDGLEPELLAAVEAGVREHVMGESPASSSTPINR